jgi:hypothetical protein
VFELVGRARRRILLNELLSQGANTGSVTLLVLILLLLAGTEILNWQWLAAFPLAAALTGAVLALRRVPGAYRTAQILDHRLGLFDALSTALHFREHPPSHPQAGQICAAQAVAAERLSEGADVRLGIPYRIPRTLYATAALLLVASSLFALRYALSRSLDLRAPLARVIQQRMGFTVRTDLARNGSRERLPAPGENQDSEEVSPNDSQADSEANPAEENAGPDRKAANPGSKQDGKKDGDLENNPDVKPVDIGGEESAEAGQDDAAGNPGKQGSAKGESKKEGSDQQQDGNSGENSSLMSKIKDAMQNLLSKVKPQQGGQQQAAGENGKQSRNQPGTKQQAAKDGQQSGEGQQSEAQAGETGEQAQNAQDSQGKSASNSDSAKKTKQPGSGMGKQDGDKSIQQAEQLAAMGKISEIIGKRSASLSGEATVEVQSTKQALHTPYSQRGAQHTQGGAEIRRDEIPVALESYVQQYFEQVRKQAPAKK